MRGSVEFRNRAFGIVGAAVADHQQLEILHGLQQHGTDRATQRGAPVVGRDDDRDGGLAGYHRYGIRRAASSLSHGRSSEVLGCS